MRRALALAMLVTTAARADVLDVPVGARATARAGAALLATDDGAALLYNPASLARRTTTRAQLGLAAARRGVSFASDASFPSASAPTVTSQSAVTLLPWIAAEMGLGDRAVLAAALFAPSSTSFSYPTAPPTFDPARDDRAAFPHRYAATRFELARRGGGVGAALRVLPWLAAGVSLLAFRVDVTHERALWAGPPGELQLGFLTPAYDMTFSVDASDAFVPGASAGLVIAPLDLPLELGAGVVWSDVAHLEGRPALSPSRGAGAAVPTVAPGAVARMDIPLPVRLRAGARLLLPRVTVEVDGELDLVRHDAPAWAASGVSFTRGEETVAIGAVALGPSFTSSFALRGAVDVEVIPAAVSLTAGYAYCRRGLEQASASPGFPDGDSHTLSLGVEARVLGATLTLGAAQTIQPRLHVPSTLEVVGSPGTDAASGRLGASRTIVALDAEVDF